ncbi:polyprenyl synthetase family protein [Paenibacillus turpanensis]|uniref:polyprenyl synthetase family protein n=1 Tax=Paenibacillus turpanensis TaxID=2689078 RepID=UPI00140E291F|nr:farnesyl diphosphate synthase [Paenibacillus turpanensis]
MDTEQLSITEYIRHWASAVEAELEQSFPGAWGIPSGLLEAMRYSLLMGGKRLRPVLSFAAAEAVGGKPQLAMPTAAAVEMIHTYSLIHDDLPAMDNDDLRRGKPTNHKVFGEASAILAGDGLLTHAFYYLTQAHYRLGVSAEQTLAMVAELSEYAGPRGMVGGQAADMDAEQGMTGLSQLEYIHLHKTSDLIVYSVRAGGRSAGASDAALQALTIFGRNIGLAFQIQDDVLDLTGDESKLGKPVKSDEKQQKVTYPFLIGLDACRSQIAMLTEEARESLLAAGLPKPRRLLEIADYLVKREY